MNRIFSIENTIRVPDGTLVSPFLNSKDITSGLQFDLVDGFSIAAGEIEPKVSSSIHIMPFVTQVTYVRRGSLTICMRDKDEDFHYEVDLVADQAALTRPGTFFQLVNRSNESCHVLYIVSPAYLFDMDENKNVIYDDSIFMDEDWVELKDFDWQPPKISDGSLSRIKRQEAYKRLSSKV